MSDIERFDSATGELVSASEAAQGIVRVDVGAMATINRSEIETQVDVAHKYPRSIAKALKEATSLATLDEDIAKACIYRLPARKGGDGEDIIGPSVRLAEIMASAWGNLHAATRVLDTEEREIVAQGIAWDIEKNLRISIEARRSIWGRLGKYSQDMIVVTGNAAASVALRNAIFRVIPRSYVQRVFAAARATVRGDLMTLAKRRARAVEAFAKIGIEAPRLLAHFDKASMEDIGLDQYEEMVAMHQSIKQDPSRREEFFPTREEKEAQAAAAKDATAKGIEGKLA